MISNFVYVLMQYNYVGDLQSNATLCLANENLSQIIIEKWWFYADDCQEDRPDLILLEEHLERISTVNEGFSAFKEERKGDRRNIIKGFSKTSNCSAISNLKETKPTESDQFPLADGTVIGTAHCSKT